MPQIHHANLVIWGEKNGWIPPTDLAVMAARCRTVGCNDPEMSAIRWTWNRRRFTRDISAPGL